MQLAIHESAVLNLHFQEMTDDEFFEFCAEHPEYRIERTALGRIEIMSGTGGKTGNRNIKLSTQLSIWTDLDQSGEAFDSSTLFLLPNSAMRSPDASWVSRRRLSSLTPEQTEKYLPLCPEFVVELMSPSDRLPDAQEKMQEWMANGCQLGWIIDPKRRQVHLYTPSGVEIVDNPSEITAGQPVPGFTLQLKPIFDPGW